MLDVRLGHVRYLEDHLPDGIRDRIAVDRLHQMLEDLIAKAFEDHQVIDWSTLALTGERDKFLGLDHIKFRADLRAQSTIKLEENDGEGHSQEERVAGEVAGEPGGSPGDL